MQLFKLRKLALSVHTAQRLFPYLMIGFIIGAIIIILSAHRTVHAAGTIYYVSSASGSDTNDGLSENTPFQTIEKVNALELQPGDSVLFKCGDIWRADMLHITQSGTQDSPITFGSYPASCADKPIISGSQPIAAWAPHADNIYVADLSAGANAGLFPHGINQLFSDSQRLPMGRWPNVDANESGGYTFVDASPAANRITDNELPSGDWTGAVIHIKTIRWLLLNREVSGSSGQTLTLAEEISCWGGGDCTGWGYFINNHLQTLDQEGEWYYDQATNRVYLYSSSSPTTIEGSVVATDDDRSWGGIVLGKDMNEHISDVVIENFSVQNWYRHGITTPTNLSGYENSRLTIRNNTVQHVDDIGINLATWVFDAQDGGESGWRGGNAIHVVNNTVDDANNMGINLYAKSSIIEYNTVKHIGLIKNLGKGGLGCGYSGSNCTENGAGIRVKLGKVADSANNNTLRGNRLEQIGHNGFDIFGPNNTLEQNVIIEPCYTKGDCGGVRTFGRDNLSSTDVHDVVIRNNIIVDSIGNTDGDAERFKPLFGMGLYIDHYSRNVEVSGNTIINSTYTGILYQNSTGSIRNNTLYKNSSGTMSAGQISLAGDATSVAAMQGNVLYGLKVHAEAWNFARTLKVGSKNMLAAADNNYYFHPYREGHISADGDKTLAEWQAYSGLDASSKTNWFALNDGDTPLSEVFYNDTQSPMVIDLTGRTYYNLDQEAVGDSMTLQPFTSMVLVGDGQGPLETPTPTPTQAAATPTPTQAAATPTPTQAAATPTPTQAAATPTPTQAAATPTPTTIAVSPPQPPRNVSMRIEESIVSLTWESSPSVDVVGYHIYRKEAHETTYTRLTTTAITALEYSDTTASYGASYTYTIVALDSIGQESDRTEPTTPAFINQLRVAIPSVYAQPGQAIAVPVVVKHADDLCFSTMDIGILYDTRMLTMTGVTNTAMTYAYTFTHEVQPVDDMYVPDQSPYWFPSPMAEVHVAYADSDSTCNEVRGTGTLFWVHFDVSPSATENMTLAFVRGLGGATMYDTDAPTTPIALALDDGEIRIETDADAAFVVGDLNRNGFVEQARAEDARIAARMATREITPTNLAIAVGDINGDTTIDAADATMILYHHDTGNWPATAPGATQQRAPHLPLRAHTGAELYDALLASSNDDAALLAANEVLIVPTTVTSTVGLTVTVTVPITVGNGAHVAGGTWVLRYGTGLHLVEVVSVLPDGFILEHHEPASNEIWCSMAGAETLGDGVQTLAQVRFTVGSDASNATTWMDITDVWLNDQAGRDFATSILAQDVAGSRGLVRLVPTPVDKPEPVDNSSRVFLPLITR